jgi:hypothetical protein
VTAKDADRLWHPWLRVERVMRELLMNHASEEALRRIEPEVRQVLAVRASVRQAGWLTSSPFGGNDGAGPEVAVWLHDEAAKLFLGLTGKRPESRWVINAAVDDHGQSLGVWVEVGHIEERRPASGRRAGKGKRNYTLNPARCLIRWDYIITVQLLAEEGAVYEKSSTGWRAVPMNETPQ